MTDEDYLGDVLRELLAVPTDTMITLDIPLLLTRLSQIPATPAAETPPPEQDA